MEDEIINQFHPDHFENLIAIITRLTSKKNKILVYLNSTAYKQFKIYNMSLILNYTPLLQKILFRIFAQS
jgi:hypothetical protein